MRGAVMLWVAVAVAQADLFRAELVFNVPDVVVQHEPAPGRAVGIRKQKVDDKRATAARREQSDQEKGVTYQEFYVEHEISTIDAKRAAKELRLENIPRHLPGCGECSREELAYCEWQVVADHCCCERRYREPYPWIPHTCYAGPEPCRPLARDCAFYTRLRDCCCDKRLAEKWHSLLASSPHVSPALPLVVCLLVISALVQLPL